MDPNIGKPGFKGYPHPFFPRGLPLPKYKAKDEDVVPDEVLPVYWGGLLLVVFLPLWIVAFVRNMFFLKNAAEKKIGCWRRMVTGWCLQSGIIFCVVFGYYLLYQGQIHLRSDKLAEIWKEYCKGDSRWFINSSQLVYALACVGCCVTGPLAILTSYQYFMQRPARFLLLLATCLLQLAHGSAMLLSEYWNKWRHTPYGDKYYANSLVAPFYYWVYVVYFNGWFVFAGALGTLYAGFNLMLNSYRRKNEEMQRAAQQEEEEKKDQ